MTLRGIIQASTPIVFASVIRGRLRLSSRGWIPLVLDTGFTGTLSLPQRVAARLTHELIAIDTFALATGDRVELSVYSGTAQIGVRRIATWFTLGEGLIGMELLQAAFSQIHFDLENDVIELVPR